MKTTLPPQIKDCLARYPKLYRVESESVILEYLQNRPNLVKVVVGKVESSPLIKNELNKNPSILVSSVEPWNSFVESPLEVQGGASMLY